MSIRSKSLPSYLDKLGPFSVKDAETMDAKFDVRKGKVFAMKVRAVAARCDSRSRKRYAVKNSDLPEWLVRQGEQHGFDVLALDSRQLSRVFGTKSRGNQVNQHPSDFVGKVRVTDEEAFRGVLESGLGRGKAYGFGLVLVSE